MDETTTTSEARTETSVVDIRTRDLSEFAEGEAVRVHYRDADDQPHKCLTGRVVLHYNDRKALLETHDLERGETREFVVDLSDVTETNIRDFETGEEIGRGMFAETAYHPEQDGEALRAELLDGLDQDEDDGEDAATDGGRETDEDLGAVVDVADAVQEGDEIRLDYEIAIGENAGNQHTHTGTVTNVSKAGSLIQYRTDGQKGTSTVSLRSGAIHVQNTFKDVHVGRDAHVTVLDDEAEEARE